MSRTLPGEPKMKVILYGAQAILDSLLRVSRSLMDSFLYYDLYYHKTLCRFWGQNYRVIFIDFRTVPLPHTNTEILQDLYCGAMKEPGWPVVLVILTSFDAMMTSLCPHSKFLKWDLFVNFITHKETQVYSLVMENSFAWTWIFSPSTCRITACAFLISRFAWRTIKQTKNLLLIIKTKQNKTKSVISYKPGHFRVASSLSFKVSRSAKPLQI